MLILCWMATFYALFQVFRPYHSWDIEKAILIHLDDMTETDVRDHLAYHKTTFVLPMEMESTQGFLLDVTFCHSMWWMGWARTRRFQSLYYLLSAEQPLRFPPYYAKRMMYPSLNKVVLRWNAKGLGLHRPLYTS